MIYWFFGYPGVGKDFCARKLSKLGKFPHIDADDFLTESDRQKLLNGTFKVEDRLKKLNRVIKNLNDLLRTNKNITIGDSLPDNRSREFVLNSFENNIKLILVTTKPEVHRIRISKRKNHFFTYELLENYIENNWEEIKVPCIEFANISSVDWDSRLKNLL